MCLGPHLTNTCHDRAHGSGPLTCRLKMYYKTLYFEKNFPNVHRHIRNREKVVVFFERHWQRPGAGCIKLLNNHYLNQCFVVISVGNYMVLEVAIKKFNACLAKYL